MLHDVCAHVEEASFVLDGDKCAFGAIIFGDLEWFSEGPQRLNVALDAHNWGDSGNVSRLRGSTVPAKGNIANVAIFPSHGKLRDGEPHLGPRVVLLRDPHVGGRPGVERNASPSLLDHERWRAPRNSGDGFGRLEIHDRGVSPVWP